MISPAAKRMARLRERRIRRVRVVPVEVDCDLLADLEALGLIDQADAADPGALAFALSMLLAAAADARRRRFKKNP